METADRLHQMVLNTAQRPHDGLPDMSQRTVKLSDAIDSVMTGVGTGSAPYPKRELALNYSLSTHSSSLCYG